MKKFNSSKKFLAGVLATISLLAVSGTCMASNTQTDYENNLVRVESQKAGFQVIRLNGEKDSVIIALAKERSKAIKEASLIASYELENLDNSKVYEARLVLSPNDLTVGYGGFEKIKEFIGDLDTLSLKAVELENNGYEELEFNGFGYEPNPKGQIVLSKNIIP